MAVKREIGTSSSDHAVPATVSGKFSVGKLGISNATESF
jgi:hypothetical protein